MKHRREPTDEEIAEEVGVLREKERAARRSLKRAREEGSADDPVLDRLHRLETAHEVQSGKLLRLEEMIYDLHSAKFGHRQSDVGHDSIDARRESDNVQIGRRSSSSPNSEKVNAPATSDCKDSEAADMGASDPYDIGGSRKSLPLPAREDQSMPELPDELHPSGPAVDALPDPASKTCAEVNVEADVQGGSMQDPKITNACKAAQREAPSATAVETAEVPAATVW